MVNLVIEKEDIIFKTVERCPLCGKKNFEMLYSFKQSRLYKCTCGMKFMNPALSDESMLNIYNDEEILENVNPALEKYYEKSGTVRKSKTFKDYNSVLIEMESIKGCGMLLDVGFGGAEFLLTARNGGWKVSGIDASKNNVERAKKQYGMELSQGEFVSTDFLGKKFDAITLWDVLEHSLKPVNMIRKSGDLLNKGGLLFIASPNSQSLLNKLTHFMYKVSFGKLKFPLPMLYPVEHVIYFDELTLKTLVEKNGFKVCRIFNMETDLAKYSLPVWKRITGEIMLVISRIFGLQNRIGVLARKI